MYSTCICRFLDIFRIAISSMTLSMAISSEHTFFHHYSWYWPINLEPYSCCSGPRNGFICAVQGLLRVREDGLFHGGPPCGTYVWVNRWTSKRSSECPDGDPSVESVANANMFLDSLDLLTKWFNFLKLFRLFPQQIRLNLSITYNWFLNTNKWNFHVSLIESIMSLAHSLLRITSRFGLLMLLAMVRCVFAAGEQPRSSVMPKSSPMEHLSFAVKGLLPWAVRSL